MTKWTETEVENLNRYQTSRAFHPFTCDNAVCRTKEPLFGNLTATTDGWICETCDYTQDWAHAFMLDFTEEAMYEAQPWKKPKSLSSGQI